jgi:hypothetical protein
MISFQELNIKPERLLFTGEKIKIEKIINREIQVHAHRLGDSTVYQGEKYLALQIEFGGEKRVVFTRSKVLMEQISRVRAESFPFKTTIKKEHEWLEFT